MLAVIAVRPARTSPKGRPAPADYLVEFRYPALLSAAQATVVVTREPGSAAAYVAGSEHLAAAFNLVQSLGYSEAEVVLLDDLA